MTYAQPRPRERQRSWVRARLGDSVAMGLGHYRKGTNTTNRRVAVIEYRIGNSLFLSRIEGLQGPPGVFLPLAFKELLNGPKTIIPNAVFDEFKNDDLRHCRGPDTANSCFEVIKYRIGASRETLSV